MKRWNVNTPVKKLKDYLEFLLENIKDDKVKIEYFYAPWVCQVDIKVFVNGIRTKYYTIFLARIKNKECEYLYFKELCNYLIKLAVTNKGDL